MSSSTQGPESITPFFRSPFVRLFIGILVVLLPVALAQVLATSLPVDRLWRNVLLGILSLPIACGTYHAFVRISERRQVIELSAKRALREFGLGALIGAGLFVVTIGILALLASYTVVGFNGWQVLAIPFIGATVSGLFEEILFRGLLFRLLEEGLGSVLALLLSAVVFGGLHLLNENATLIGALSVMFEAGIMLAAAFMWTRRLWLPIGIHFAWNFTQSGIFGIAVSGNDPLPGLLRSALAGPAWLTGGAFGAEASAVAVVLCTVAGICMLVIAAKAGRVIAPPWRRLPKA